MVGVQSKKQFEELGSAAGYRVLHNELRAAAVRSSIIGVVLGLVSMCLSAGVVHAAAPLGVLLWVLGAALIAASIWMLSALTPMAALVSGFAWLSVGGCYIAAAAQAGEGAEGSVMGILMMAASWFSFYLYSPLSALQTRHPPEETLEQSDQIVKDIRQATTASDPRIIEFGNGIAWKGWLGDVGGIFAGQRGWDVFFLEREDVSIEREEGEPAGGNLEATFRLGEYSFSGTISSEALLRYNEWKQEGP